MCLNNRHGPLRVFTLDFCNGMDVGLVKKLMPFPYQTVKKYEDMPIRSDTVPALRSAH